MSTQTAEQVDMPNPQPKVESNTAVIDLTVKAIIVLQEQLSVGFSDGRLQGTYAHDLWELSEVARLKALEARDEVKQLAPVIAISA